jgi:predicted acyl esterase
MPSFVPGITTHQDVNGDQAERLFVMNAVKRHDDIAHSVTAEQTAGGVPFVFEKDVAVAMSDGLSLRVNIFRPAKEGRFPVVMSHGVYGKDVHFNLAFKPQWENLLKIHPDLVRNGSSGRFLRWEVPDPERWVPDDFIIVVADARGSGKSPGFLDPRSPRENQDYYELIEWAGEQPWSNGKIGLLGISYLAINQWSVAALNPPHLAAICPWEGYWDHYRDNSHHGGILSSSFMTGWWPRQVLSNQHGNGKTHYVDPDTGERTTGPALSDELLAGNRTDHVAEHRRHHLNDEWHRGRTPDIAAISAPLLSAGNWGGPGVHLRGNVGGFVDAGSREKWLSLHIGTHYESFYLPAYVAMQKRFFEHYLRGADNGWEREPPVRLEIRDVHGGAVVRHEHEWPLARTRWTPYYLDALERTLDTSAPAAPARVSFSATGDGVTFSTAPFEHDTEITGYVAARLWVSSSTSDMDIFAVLRAFDAAGNEVKFIGAHEPTPVSRGWLRASHRKLDPDRSLPYRPFFSHDEVQKLAPAAVYPVDVEIWPTCLVWPKGYRLALTLMGKDFEFDGIAGRLLHTDPDDRPMPEFGGTSTIVTGGDHDSYLLLPVIPAQS